MTEKIKIGNEPEINDPWDEIMNGPDRDAFMEGAKEVENVLTRLKQEEIAEIETKAIKEKIAKQKEGEKVEVEA